MTCACLEQINDALAEQGENTVLGTCLLMDMDTMTERVTVKIAVEKLDSRNRKPALPMIPTFCPFCSKAYVENDGPAPSGTRGKGAAR
jgi:hypothetical protein